MPLALPTCHSPSPRSTPPSTEGLKPAAVVAEVLRALAAADDPGIFITVAPAPPSSPAAEALGPFDPARPLWGIRSRSRTTSTSPALRPPPPAGNTPTTRRRMPSAVRRLRNAGALIIGKTNLDQFATGLVGVRTPYPVPRNPIDPSLVPGGSSSGSAVAVATRYRQPLPSAPTTAGSGRVPAAFNNIVGLKPSNGAVSSVGMVPGLPLARLHIGPRADGRGRAGPAFGAMASFDERDPYAARLAPAPSIPALPPRLRIGVPRRGGSASSGPPTRPGCVRHRPRGSRPAWAPTSCRLISARSSMSARSLWRPMGRERHAAPGPSSPRMPTRCCR